MEERARRSAALAQVNGSILGLASSIHGKARDSASDDELWDFFCECGREDCDRRASLTIAAYSALRDADEAILAPGHTLSRAGQARRRAQRLRDDAAALRAQAEHQANRANKNRD